MSCHDQSAVEEPHLAVVGDEREGAFGVYRGDRVAVGVEADEGLAVNAGGRDEVGVGQRIGQRKQACALVAEHLADGARREHGMRARVCDVGNEAAEVDVAGGDGRNHAPREEAIAQVPDRALDASLVLGPSNGA